MKDMNLRMLFSTDTFINQALHNLIYSIDLNMEMDVILHMKLLNIEVIIVLNQQKVIVLPNAIIS